MFYLSEGLESVKLPKDLTYIPKGTFEDCMSLSDITLSDAVTYIGDYAFGRCTSLKSLTIPESVTEVGMSVFDDWTSSQTINIKGVSKEPYGWSTKWDNNCEANIVWNA